MSDAPPVTSDIESGDVIAAGAMTQAPRAIAVVSTAGAVAQISAFLETTHPPPFPVLARPSNPAPC